MKNKHTPAKRILARMPGSDYKGRKEQRMMCGAIGKNDGYTKVVIVRLPGILIFISLYLFFF
jgi:hypothetical protein